MEERLILAGFTFLISILGFGFVAYLVVKDSIKSKKA